MQTPEHPAAAGQPARPPRRILAEHLELALVARKVRPGTRWAAMAEHAETSFCRQRQAGGGWLIHRPPLMAPMHSGHMRTVLERVRCQGRDEVLRTWGCGVRALQAEFATSVLHTRQGARL